MIHLPFAVPTKRCEKAALDRNLLFVPGGIYKLRVQQNQYTRDYRCMASTAYHDTWQILPDTILKYQVEHLQQPLPSTDN